MLSLICRGLRNAKTLAAIEEVENMIETGKGEHFEGSTADLFAQLAAEG